MNNHNLFYVYMKLWTRLGKARQLEGGGGGGLVVSPQQVGQPWQVGQLFLMQTACLAHSRRNNSNRKCVRKLWLECLQLFFPFRSPFFLICNLAEQGLADVKFPINTP